MFREKDLARLVKQHGESLSLTSSTSSGTYNPQTGVVDGGTTATVTFRGYIFVNEAGVTDASQVVVSDRRCFIPKSQLPNTVPTDKDMISDDEVTMVRTIKSNGVVMCYICHLKGP